MNLSEQPDANKIHCTEQENDFDGEDKDDLDELEKIRKALLAQLEEENDEEDMNYATAMDMDEENNPEPEQKEETPDSKYGISNSLLNATNAFLSTSSCSSRNEYENQEPSSNEESRTDIDDEEDQGEVGDDIDDENVSGWTTEEELLERELLAEVGPDQIDSLLEQPVEDSMEQAKPKHLTKKFKRVLEFRGTDHFDVLPDGWIEITHASGLPVYLHKPTRVCTFSRPYFIGRCSIRNHKVPESTIPCLFQQKVLNEMKQQQLIVDNGTKIDDANKNVDGGSDCPAALNTDPIESKNDINKFVGAPNVAVKTEVDKQRAQLTPDQLYDYAKRRFRFKNICVYRFGKWQEARKFYRRQQMRQVLVDQHHQQQALKAKTTTLLVSKTSRRHTDERPALPSDVQLITLPMLERDLKPNRRPFYLNPQGKTSVSILHEFVQKALKCAVRYFFSETRSSATPFHCVVKLVLGSALPPIGYNNIRNPSDGQRIQKQELAAEIVRQKLAQIHDFNFKKHGQLSTDKLANDQHQNNSGEDTEFITLGEGIGAGKKNAKLLAAKNALAKLVPGIEFDADGIALSGGRRTVDQNGTLSMLDACNTSSNHFDSSMASTSYANNTGTTPTTSTKDASQEIFDMIGITDTRVPELCARAGQPSPYLILQEYLKRYSAFGDTAIDLTSRRLRHQRHEFVMTIGEHKVRVVSGNKRDGKQMAAQAMLKTLHPNSDTWGAIVRLYGYEAQQKFREARKSKESVVKLQGIQDDSKGNGRQFQPNALILDKLRTEMLKLSEKLVTKHRQHDAEHATAISNNGIDPSTSTANTSSATASAPQAKYRRVDFQWDLPILSEDQLRELSAKFEAERPDMQKCIPTVRF